MAQIVSEERTPTVLGASVRGPKHEERGEKNQDNWDAAVGDDYLIIAVGDGLGTSPRAAEASRLATETAVATLDQWIEGANTLRSADPSIVKQQLFDAVTASREVVRDLAASEQVSTDKFHTTLSLVVATSDWYAAGAIGDSGVVSVTDEDCFKLVEREDSKSAYATTSVLSDRPTLTERFRFGHGERSLHFVAGFSDGLDDFVWDRHDHSKPRSEFFDQIRDFIEATDEFGTDTQSQFTEFVDNDYFHKYSSDDKTLVIGCVTTDSDAGEAKTGIDAQDYDETAESGSAVSQKRYADEAFISAVRNSDSPKTAEIREVVGCSQSTARRRLRDLEDRDILKSQSAGRTNKWQRTDEDGTSQ